MNVPLGPEAFWRAALAEGRFLLQKSASDGRYVFPPRTQASGTNDLKWVNAKGTGSVYSVTLISPKPPLEPYNVVLVALDEGPRLMSRVEGVSSLDVKIGMRVKARIEEKNSAPILVFDPA
jgi:uncharacterized protein